MADVVTFPPSERVGVIGPLNAVQLGGTSIALGLFVVGIMVGDVVNGAIAAGVVVSVTFAKWQGRPARLVVLDAVNWMHRRDKTWTAPLRGGGSQAPCLRPFTFHLDSDGADSDAAPVCVVEAKPATYSVVFCVDSPSTVLMSTDEQTQRFNAWGEVLAGLCVERGTVLVPERIAWSDIHQASDPASLARHHREHGVAGPASDDYAGYVAQFSSVAASHRVLVTVSITRAGRYKLAKQLGVAGRPGEVMRRAAVTVGRDTIAELERHGFRCGPLLTPAELARVVVGACDPHAMRPDVVSPRERFGLPERTGPDQVSVERHHVSMDGSCHRVFTIRWPRTDVDAAWMHLPLAVPGPKVMTTVYAGVAPSAADVRREMLTSRSESNNVVTEHRRGRVRTRDRQKSKALLDAERAVAAGHQDLDGYSLVVVSGRDAAELNQRSALLRQALRQAGRAEVRELTANHDKAFAAALPLGMWVKDTIE